MKKVLFVALFVSLSASAFGQEKTSSETAKDLNVDFMLRGYFYAGSLIKDQHALGGFGKSRNFSKAVEPGMNFPQGKISLVARPDDETVFAEKYRGMKVLLANMTGEQVAFTAQDSRLYIVQEALDRDGKWKPVEYLPSSWCGNSYHRVILADGQYWEFAAARFAGKLKTKLRFRLDHQKSKTEKIVIYSNEFVGSVNREQFTNRRPYTPSSIMDPYDN